MHQIQCSPTMHYGAISVTV